MYYIEQIDGELIKYEVELDEERLIELKKIIINECGRIEHKSYDGTNGPSRFDYLHIKNYFEKRIGRTETNDDLTNPPQDIYHFDYDYYHDTELVSIIDKLLNGETNVIFNLMYKIGGQQPLEYLEQLEQEIKNKIIELHKQMPTADNMGIVKIADRIQDLSSQLKKIEKNKELNKDRKSDLEYYSDVLECVKLEEVARIEVDTIEEFNLLYKKVNSFFISTNSTNINQEVNKELYKRLVIK